ncbi:MAG: efflux RND transporter periplasmic adaptor subunit [Bacteroidia bacterium]|nr:efflux RND transporter periplasmic adaptor subunit [Bacteroidia bacterium]
MKPGCKTFYTLVCVLIFAACSRQKETTHVSSGPVSESVYASGTIKSKDQYQVFAQANGIISQVSVKEGDTVKKGQPILFIDNDIQKLSKENAELAAKFSDFGANQTKITDAAASVDLAYLKMLNDSVLYARQSALWSQNIGTKVELEQRELAMRNSKTAYLSAKLKLADLRRQLEFSSSQAKKNLLISSVSEDDYTVKSEINGIVYSLNKVKGEMVNVQTPLAIIGDAHKFILEMQVDEYDIVKIRNGQVVIINMDSYKDQVFEGKVTRIFPLMNERSKTFIVEAEFVNAPPVLYPNISFEANIIINHKEQALLIPRNYLLNDSNVLKKNGEKITVKTGLKDYQVVEILKGLNKDEEILKPE